MSFIGGFVGIFALASAAPLIFGVRARFPPRDYLLLAIMGILLVGACRASR